MRLELRERDGEWSALLANAGHPPPLQITADGAEFLNAPGVLLGAGFDRPRTTATVALAPGSTPLLYTDGLVEQRQRDLDAVLEELRAIVAPSPGRPVGELCDDVLARLATEPSDDVCLLAVRVPGAGP